MLEPDASQGQLSHVVAFLAPTAADAAIASKILHESNIPAAIYQSFSALIDAIAVGVGAVVLVRECFAAPEYPRLEEVLAAQPPWSAVPLVVLSASGAQFPRPGPESRTLRNSLLLERPIAVSALTSAIRSALALRERQYEIRDYLAAAVRAADERLRLHAEALQARTAAENANRMKDEFLAVVSHELRTPLNAILGWATLLHGGRLDAARARQATEAIERNAKIQAQLIEDLLDISRIISGTLRLDVQPVDLVQVIEQALATVTPAVTAKGLRLFKVLDPNAGPVSGDPGRLQQVIWNLLSNAVKFTPKGGRIQVLLERINSHVEIRVSDSGQGIAPEFLQLVFERFRQVDSSTTRLYGGLGLGLSIVRQLVELHGGHVVAESAGVGQGATFVVRLPFAAVQRRIGLETSSETKSQETISIPSPQALQGLRILSIDDEIESSRVLAESLQIYGAEVVSAGSVAQGLETLRSMRLDVVICDIGMPQEDGYSFIKKMRAFEETAGKFTPAIALTAYARIEDRIRTVAAGFQAHVAKPANPLELVAVVAGLAKISTR